MKKIKDLNLTERELRVLSIVFVSAMQHDWNDWFDDSNGMTGESEEYCNALHNKLHFVFDNLGVEGLNELLLNESEKTKIIPPPPPPPPDRFLKEGCEPPKPRNYEN